MANDGTRMMIRNPFDCVSRIGRGAKVESFASMLCVDDPAEWLAVIGGALVMRTSTQDQNEPDEMVQELAKLDVIVTRAFTPEQEAEIFGI
ncbi:hypothetical protein [Allorhodopirellula heiligendammensis]|uniref:Uncharacterized protein n=1 Tax=Allorhodopirellula heiligendammensis TaxID=2714739 RepID=A0A5C6C649_9BACT|nr:hypothetical protein [Allorhodopirellula heiligendammensis]TWU19532.1 hypothetical protein Poly21_17060 [Allorhodopirellula heiligendammensis]